MYFDSFDSFIDMGGHGFYVWLAYSLFLVIILWNILMLKIGRASSLQDAKRTWQREKLSAKKNVNKKHTTEGTEK